MRPEITLKRQENFCKDVDMIVIMSALRREDGFALNRVHNASVHFLASICRMIGNVVYGLWNLRAGI
jgi:hypothetical protein